MTYIKLFSVAVLVFAGQASSAAFTPTHPIRARSVITSDDVVEIDQKALGSVEYIEDLVGQEARTTLYPGRIILQSDVIDRAQIQRNTPVTLIYNSGILSIITDGRALEQGKIGDLIRVMNLESKITVVGTITGDGTVEVRK